MDDSPRQQPEQSEQAMAQSKQAEQAAGQIAPGAPSGQAGAGNEQAAPSDQKIRCGMIAVVGRVNAGKSTLVNRIIGEKISIVSPVAQTTRNVIRGVLTDERGQLALIDTPGMHKASHRFCAAMNKRARSALEGVDAVLLVVDGSREPQTEDDGWMRRMLFSELPCIFLLNKSDEGTKKDAYLAMWDAIREEKQHSKSDVAWMEASAKTGDGVDALVERLFALLPLGPMLFDPEMLTDFPRKLAVGDVVREKLFLRLRDEMPHEVGVRVDEIAERPGAWDVNVTIFVRRPSQKGIVIGPKGRMLRAVKRASDAELSSMYGVKVSVTPWVKIDKDWQENYFLLREMGYAGV